MDPARIEWNLQREVVFRAKRVIFSELTDLGGPPTSVEELRQLGADAQAADAMMPVLRDVLDSAGLPGILGAIDGEGRGYWEGRAPGLMAFGARTHSELAALAPSGSRHPGPLRASALFQLAASLFDWLGDEAGGSDELAAVLPTELFRQFCADRRVRRETTCRIRCGATGGTAAFVTLVGACLDLADDAGGDASRVEEALWHAYEAELASFVRVASPERRLAMAWDKFIAPTAVIGELASLDVPFDPAGVVAGASHAIAPVFGRIDDVADLSSDLHAGALNTISATAGCVAEGRCEVADTLREILDAGLIDDAAAAVTRDVRLLERIMIDADVAADRRRQANEWLRTTIWRWLS